MARYIRGTLAHTSQAEAKKVAALHKADSIILYRKSNGIVRKCQKNFQMLWVCMLYCVRDSFLANSQQGSDHFGG